MKNKTEIFFIIIIFVFCSTFVNSSSAITSEDSVKKEIKNAQEKIEEAYLTLKIAEENSVEITDSVLKLENCLIILENSKQKLLNNDFERASILANESNLLALEVTYQAQQLLSEQIEINQIVARENLINLLLQIVIITIFFILSWLIFKRFYIVRLLKLKPSVTKNES